MGKFSLYTKWIKAFFNPKNTFLRGEILLYRACTSIHSYSVILFEKIIFLSIDHTDGSYNSYVSSKFPYNTSYAARDELHLQRKTISPFIHKCLTSFCNGSEQYKKVLLKNVLAKLSARMTNYVRENEEKVKSWV